MKFEVHRDDMRNLLGHVTRVIERNQTREILSNAVVSIDSENKLRLGCTDLETTITAQLQLFNVEELGEATLSWKPTKTRFLSRVPARSSNLQLFRLSN